MKISILMPSFNSGEYIREAIDSVVQQQLCDWELIIQDACSSDGTISVVESFDDPRITLIR